jgi:hypothetical protein
VKLKVEGEVEAVVCVEKGKCQWRIEEKKRLDLRDVKERGELMVLYGRGRGSL